MGVSSAVNMESVLLVLFFFFSIPFSFQVALDSEEGDDGIDFDEDDYGDSYDEDIEEDFDYFYNLEMINTLDELALSSDADPNEDLDDEGTNYYNYDDSTELDVIFDELLNEENLIDDALNSFDVPVQDIPTPKDTKLKTRNFLSLANVILVGTTLGISVILILVCLATRNCCAWYRKVAKDEEEDSSSEIREELKAKIWKRSSYDLYPVSLDI